MIPELFILLFQGPPPPPPVTGIMATQLPPDRLLDGWGRRLYRRFFAGSNE